MIVVGIVVVALIVSAAIHAWVIAAEDRADNRLRPRGPTKGDAVKVGDWRPVDPSRFIRGWWR